MLLACSYSCHLCPKTFGVSSSLKAHLKSHERRNETSTTECPKCGHVLPDHDTFKFHVTQCSAYVTDMTEMTTMADMTDDSEHHLLSPQPRLHAPATPSTTGGSHHSSALTAPPTGRASNSPGERSGGDPASPAQNKQAVQARMQSQQQHNFGHSGLGKVTGIHDDELMAVAASLLDSVHGKLCLNSNGHVSGGSCMLASTL
jgi:DNA-directed RNA polymerase subunit RPC12/RpoP